MEGLNFSSVPSLHEPTMIVAFAGWPDAHEGATHAVRYLIKDLKAERFADIDPEVYYDFTQVRPVTRLNENGERTVIWPANEFYHYAHTERMPKDLIFFVGIEPNLRWRSFVGAMMEVARQCDVKTVISLGALLDAVPHTRDIRVTGTTPDRSLRRSLGLQGSSYQGPTGITTALMEACQGADIPFASLWGHSPHYLQVAQNPKVSQALLVRLGEIMGGVEFNLEGLRSSGISFEKELQDVMASNVDLNSYISRLEQDYDSSFRPSANDMPSSESIVQGIEEFFRQQRSQGSSD